MRILPRLALIAVIATASLSTIATAQQIVEYPPIAGNVRPSSIVLGPDGNYWFTEIFGDKVGRVTPAGVVTEFVIHALDPRYPTAP